MDFPSAICILPAMVSIGKISRGPSVQELAEHAGVSTATVDRVLNGRGLVSDATAAKVVDALEQLRKSRTAARKRIAFLCESGESFNKALEEAVMKVAWRRQDLDLAIYKFSSYEVGLLSFAQRIEREADSSDGLVIVARQDPIVIRAVRSVRRRGVPVICLATDLPKTCRDGYVGSDERSAGAAAAELLSNLLRLRGKSILFIACGHYHAAKDREEGFRTILREKSPNLSIVRRLDAQNDPDRIYHEVKNFISEAGSPDAIYSIAGGNTGIGRALQELNLDRDVLFLGHELHENSRKLLKSGVMDYLIGRDQFQEVMISISMMEAVLEGRPHQDKDEMQVRIICRHTCG